MSELNKVIVSANVRILADKCEEKQLITASMKEMLVSSSTGRTDSERASQLIDNIRRSLTHDSDEMLDEFLCVIFNMGGCAGQGLVKRIAKQCELIVMEICLCIG